mgnify:CR=1 FL=1
MAVARARKGKTDWRNRIKALACPQYMSGETLMPVAKFFVRAFAASTLALAAAGPPAPATPTPRTQGEQLRPSPPASRARSLFIYFIRLSTFIHFIHIYPCLFIYPDLSTFIPMHIYPLVMIPRRAGQPRTCTGVQCARNGREPQLA